MTDSRCRSIPSFREWISFLLSVKSLLSAGGNDVFVVLLVGRQFFAVDKIISGIVLFLIFQSPFGCQHNKWYMGEVYIYILFYFFT